MLCDFTKIPINGKCVCYCVCVFLVRDRIEKNRLVKGQRALEERGRARQRERKSHLVSLREKEGQQSRAVCERSS